MSLKIGIAQSGTISLPYITGVIYCNAITKIPRIYCKSRRYTVRDATINAMPRHSMYSTIITTGRQASPRNCTFLPLTSSAAKITIKVKSILTKPLVTVAIGSTSRGK